MRIFNIFRHKGHPKHFSEVSRDVNEERDINFTPPQ